MTPGESRAPSLSAAGIRANNLARLLKREREIATLRWLVMVVYLIFLQRQEYEFGLNKVWLVYFISLAFTAFTQWLLRNPESVRINAGITMISDPLIAAGMCSVTGGIESIFFPFLYFTSLAAAFRFGLRETLAIFGINFMLSVLLYMFASRAEANFDLLLTAVFYHCFATMLGAMFARWARDNLALAKSRSQALNAANERMRSLLHRLINVEEVERKYIADDLHDRMGVKLFTLQQGIDHCLREVGPKSAISARLTTLAREARACSDDVRVLMNELRPTVLDELGFVETLGEYVANVAELVPFNVKLVIEPALHDWSSKQDALLFRMVQEATLNVRKHAQASKLSIELTERDNAVMLHIYDDGVGFDPANIPAGHYGLLTMRERAEILGGSFAVDSEPGSGASITVQLPR